VEVGSYWECGSNEYVFIVTMITERVLTKNVYEPRIIDMLNISNHNEKRELFVILPFSFHGCANWDSKTDRAKRKVEETSMYEICSHSVSTQYDR
jgi:hypothetical protein